MSSSSGGGLSIGQVRAVVKNVLYSIFPAKLINDPAGYVLYVVMGAIVSGVLDFGERVIEIVQLLGFGSTETYGIAEIPALAVGILVDAGAPVGDAVFGVYRALDQSIQSVAADAGIFGPPVAVGLWVVATVATGSVLWVLVRLLAEWLQVSTLLESAAGWVRSVLGGIRS